MRFDPGADDDGWKKILLATFQSGRIDILTSSVRFCVTIRAVVPAGRELLFKVLGSSLWKVIADGLNCPGCFLASVFDVPGEPSLVIEMGLDFCPTRLDTCFGVI